MTIIDFEIFNHYINEGDETNESNFVKYIIVLVEVTLVPDVWQERDQRLIEH